MIKLSHRCAPLLFSTLVACGAAPRQEPTLPGPTLRPAGTAEEAPVPTDDPFALKQPVREEWLPMLKGPEAAFAEVTLAKLPKGVAPPPAKECDPFVKRAPKSKAVCADRAAALPLLDQAMAKTGEERDQALVEIEGCAGLPAGAVRSLRAELAPEVCADAIVLPVLGAAGEKAKDDKAKDKGKPAAPAIPGAIQHAMIGQALAARLARAVQDPPSLKAPYTKDRVSEFVKGPLFKWFNDQAVAVQELASSGSQLSYYGKGVAALAAGSADLRMVDVMREVPIPDEFKKDPELANAYYSSLDEKLEPRKDRGRNGALVGLKEMAHAGVIADARTARARGLLAKLYAGRRIDSLDGLAMPAAQPSAGDTPTLRLAATLPTFYANLVLEPETLTSAAALRALSQRGLPVRLRVLLKESDATLPGDARIAYAHGRLTMGLQYWRADDFDMVAYQLSKVAKAELPKDERLVLALAIALRGGPEDAAALMLKNEGLPQSFADVRALDVVASEDKSATAAMAAFDAATIKQLAAPRFSDAQTTAKYWSDLAERYRIASAMAEDPRLKLKADDLSKAAAATAKFAEKAP